MLGDDQLLVGDFRGAGEHVVIELPASKDGEVTRFALLRLSGAGRSRWTVLSKDA